jgi:ankyrin repeat protein
MVAKRWCGALLNAEADVGAKPDRGLTALMMASKLGRQEIVQLLKSAGAADR